eukprot:6333-Heterococcus_DN1.PRE.1
MLLCLLPQLFLAVLAAVAQSADKPADPVYMLRHALASSECSTLHLHMFAHQRSQQGEADGPLWDMERSNGTGYYYNPKVKACKKGDSDIPNVPFVTYWDDTTTRRPVKWIFSSGMTFDVISFTPFEKTEESLWQIPAYCFDKTAIRVAEQTADSNSSGMSSTAAAIAR